MSTFTLGYYIDKINLLLECSDLPRLTAIDMPTITAAHEADASLATCWTSLNRMRDLAAYAEHATTHAGAMLAYDVESFKRVKDVTDTFKMVSAGFGLRVKSNGCFVPRIFQTHGIAGISFCSDLDLIETHELFYRVPA